MPALGSYFAGVQFGAVRADRSSWNELDGRWRGPAPLLSTPIGMTAGGALVNGGGALPFERVASGAPGAAVWRTSYVPTVVADESNAMPSTFAYALVDVATGEIVSSAGAPVAGTLPYAELARVTLPPLIEGRSYALWARVATAYTGVVSTATYRALVGSDVPETAFYEEGGARHFWDVVRNLGRQPSDPAHPFYAERARLVSLNLAIDKPEYSRYSTSAAPLEGDWSCLLIHAGAGTWAAGAGVLPYPGAELVSVLNAGANTHVRGVPLDYLARRVTASKVLDYAVKLENGSVYLPAGTTVIGGERSSASGPEMCAWAYVGDAATGQWLLLGKSEVHTTGTCECILQAFHTVTGIAQWEDGRVLLINRCSKHLLVPDAPTLGERLPAYPADQGGHPGGHGLELVGHEPHWMTESFMQGTVGEQEGVAQFYNTHMSLAGGRIASGVGGAFHGNNCACWHRGAYWTIVQDQPSENSTQRLARWGGSRWEFAGRPSWPAAVYKMQRLISSGGRLFAFGYRPDTGRGVAAFMDATGWQWMEFPYRVDRVSAHREKLTDGTERNVVLVVAQHVTTNDPDLKALPYSLVRIYTGGDGEEPPTVGQCFFYDHRAGTLGGFCADRQLIESKGITITPGGDLPDFLAWSVGNNTWVRMTNEPTRGPYLRKIVGELTVCYVLVCTADAPSSGFAACWPYDPNVWGKICWSSGDGGNEWPPRPRCTSAACPDLPPGTKYQIIEIDLQSDWWALQVDDVQSEKFLTQAMRLYPCVWAQIDSDAAATDLSSYTFHIPRPNTRIDLGRRALRRVRVCFLWPPTLHGVTPTVRGYAVQPRE